MSDDAKYRWCKIQEATRTARRQPMVSNNPVIRCGAAGVVAVIALVFAGGAAAGMFTTAATLSDFNIDWSEDTVIYVTPSLDQVVFEINEADNQVVLTSVDGAAAEVDRQRGGWAGTLKHRGEAGSTGPNSYDGNYTTFGALQEFQSVGEGVEMTLDAMEPAGGDRLGASGYPSWLGFLLSGPSTGAHANDLRVYGVYVHVAGLTEDYWARLLQSDSAGSFLEVRSSAMAAGGENRAEMPTPATPLLLLAGMVGWRMMRHRV
jgi:hypothetical protein